MDGQNYTSQSFWNINQSKAEKAYKNGINYTDKGLELCWGIEYGSHTYTINYTINNLVWQYDDMQIMYFSFLPQNMDPAPQKFNLTISGYKEFTDLKYSSYGFNSTNSIQNGKIYFNSKDSLASSDYVVALVGFPNKTFNLVTIKSGTYSDVANEALEGDYFK